MVPADGAEIAAAAVPAVATSVTRPGVRAPRMRWVALAAAYAAACWVALAHLGFGVDLQDEAYYIAFAYRFARGDLPILDDRSMHQFGSLLLVLPVKAYLAVVGSTWGMVHFVRILYLGVLLLVLMSLVFALRRLVGWWWAALVCLPLVFYAPMGISGLSYNSVSALALLLACAWGMRSGMADSGPRPAFASGVLAAVCAVAYPPLAIAATALIVALGLVLRRRHGVRRAFVPLAGFVATMAPVLAYVAWCGLGTAADVLRMSELGGGEGGGLYKLGMAVARPVMTVLFWPVPLLLGLIGLKSRSTRPLLAAVAFALVPLSGLGGVPGKVMWRPMAWQSGFIAYMGGMAIVLYLATPRTERTRLVMLTMIVPAAVAAITVSYSSFINIGVSGQGLLPAFVAMMLFGTWLLRERGPAGRPGVPGTASEPAAWRGWVAVGMVGSVAVCMGLLQWQAVFQDHAPAELTARVSGGPWDGLRTTPQRRAYVETLDRDLARVIARDDRVLVYTWCPGAYLAAQGRVASPLICTGGVPALRGELSERLDRDLPEMIIEDRYYWWTRSPFDPLRTLVSEHGYVPRVKRPWYTVYERRSTT